MKILISDFDLLDLEAPTPVSWGWHKLPPWPGESGAGTARSGTNTGSARGIEWRIAMATRPTSGRATTWRLLVTLQSGQGRPVGSGSSLAGLPLPLCITMGT